MPEPEPGTGSITRWIGDLKAGDPDAARPLWDRYFAQLVRVARAHLGRAPGARDGADEEDVALSAFWSVCAGVRAERFPRLDDRDDLWRLLLHVTACKAVDQVQHARAAKRGGGRVTRAADLDADDEAILDHVVGREPSPIFAAMLAEEYRRLIDRLGDPTLARIAEMKLAGHTNDEIRAHLGCSLRTVTLRLELIRKTWQRESGPAA